MNKDWTLRVQSFLCIPLKNKNNRSRFSYKKARYEQAKKIDNSFLWITYAGLLCKNIQIISDYYSSILKLSAVRKVPEIIMFQALGIIETLGSIISHGTSSKFADVRTHLRKVSKNFFFNLRPIPSRHPSFLFKVDSR